MRVFGQTNVPLRRTVRHGAVAVVVNPQGEIALDEVRMNSRVFVDLPGGGLQAKRVKPRAVNPGGCNELRGVWESEEEALVRELAEEVGLVVQPGSRLGEAIQLYQSSDGRTEVLSYTGCWTATQSGTIEPTERNHELVWLEPLSAIARLRHDAHKQFVVDWLTWEQRDRGCVPSLRL